MYIYTYIYVYILHIYIYIMYIIYIYTYMLHFTLEKIRVSITGLCAESHGDLPALIGSPLRLGNLDHYNNLRPILISFLSCLY